MSNSVEDLLQFNRNVLAQALELLEAFQQSDAPPLSEKIGPHLRHIVEHYEALAWPSKAGIVDYDSRARDRLMESNAAVAIARIEALIEWLNQGTFRLIPRALKVAGRGGIHGEFAFVVESSLARELVFLASHAVHHFALMKPYCDENDISTLDGFGKAPATLAYERSQSST
jgi:hypothetical protein